MGTNGKAEPDSVLLAPEDAHNAAIVSIAAWLAELKTRQAVFEETLHEMRVAGKYPQNPFSGLFDVCERVEAATLRQRPELFGMPAPESSERANVRTARTNLEHAEEMYATIKGRLAESSPDTPAYTDFLAQAQGWARSVRRYRSELASALRLLPDATNQDRKEIIELTRGSSTGAEEITLRI